MKTIEHKCLIVLFDILISLVISSCGGKEEEPEQKVDELVLVTFSAKAFPNDSALRELPTDFGNYRLTIVPYFFSHPSVDTLFKYVEDGIMLRPSKHYVFRLEYSIPDTILQPLPYQPLYVFKLDGTWHKHVKPMAFCENLVYIRPNWPNHIEFNVMYQPWVDICSKSFNGYYLCNSTPLNF